MNVAGIPEEAKAVLCGMSRDEVHEAYLTFGRHVLLLARKISDTDDPTEKERWRDHCRRFGAARYYMVQEKLL